MSLDIIFKEIRHLKTSELHCWQNWLRKNKIASKRFNQILLNTTLYKYFTINHLNYIALKHKHYYLLLCNTYLYVTSYYVLCQFFPWARVHSYYDVIHVVQYSVLQIIATPNRMGKWKEVMQLPLIISTNFEVSKVCSLKVGVA